LHAGLLERTSEFSLLKQKRITMSDWSRIPLTQPQLQYAACDAYAGAATSHAHGCIVRLYGAMHTCTTAIRAVCEDCMAAVYELYKAAALWQKCKQRHPTVWRHYVLLNKLQQRD
jgi:hypothetical protein